MRIVKCTKVEDCFNGSSVYSYEFDESWNLSLIRLLEALGKLQYYADFPRPLFRITSPGGLFIKGVDGDTACRVIYPREGGEEARNRFESQFHR